MTGATVGTYENIITGLFGAETGLATVGNWIAYADGFTATFSYDGAGGVDLNVTAIPEPGSLGMMFGGMALVGLRRWRRR